MYVRQPNAHIKSIKIPENYHGNAFSEPQLRDMPPPLRQSVQDQHPFHGDLPPDGQARFEQARFEQAPFEQAPFEQAPTDEVPQIGAEQSSEERSPLTDSEKFPVRAEETKSERGERAEQSSLFSSLLPPISKLDGHFPFGHGIGSEELLIMAMMLLVYLSGAEDGRADNELLLLLGLLLFAG